MSLRVENALETLFADPTIVRDGVGAGGAPRRHQFWRCPALHSTDLR